MRAFGGRAVAGQVAVAAAVLLTIGLAGCTSSTTTPTTPPSSTKTAAAPGSGSASASSTPSGSGTATPPSSSSATPSTSSTPVAGAPCTTAHLTGSLSASNGAAGTTYSELILTNSGAVSCTLQGWPGVSWVGGGAGTQIGQAAAFDRTGAHPTVTLNPGKSAQALLAMFGYNDTAGCKPEAADGLRVYPPGQRASLFIEHSAQACSGIASLRVRALN